MITIHGPAPSTYVRTARIACLEKGVPHELVPVELAGDAHRALHPWAKVPILEHSGLVLYETSAIVRYVDDRFGGPSLVPGDAAERALMEQWISAYNSYIYADLIRDYALQYIFPRGPDGGPDRAVIDRAVPRMQHDLDIVERGLEGRPHLAGTFSLADLFLGPCLHTAAAFPEGKAAIGARPNVAALAARLMERESFRRVS
jgi:glutathione S-transferase